MYFRLNLALNPCHEKIDDPLLPLGGDLNPARQSPPFREAVSATAGAGVLRLEHGVPAHRGLLPVVRRVRGREARSDEVLAMAADRLQPLVRDVLPIGLR